MADALHSSERMLALVAAVAVHATTSSAPHIIADGQPTLSPPPLTEAETPSPKAPERAWFGLVFDAGAPSGAGVSLAWRPLSWLQLEVGGATNGMAPGARAGLVLSPLRTFVRPTLSLHAGQFAVGDAQPWVRWVMADESFRAPLLDDLRYDYAAALLGLELGAPDGLSFFLRGGISRTTIVLGGLEAQLRELSGDESLTATTPTLEVIAPSLQLGAEIFF
ncbi:MAG: hypothetical protein IRZ16_08705 [Myxococcaceae bacterium]|nr:hypothetical protein [Myxococcaceae bacterium]